MRMRFSQSVISKCFVIFGFFLSLCSTALSDKLILKDGKTQTGTVIEETVEYVRFRDAQLGELRFPRSQVQDVVREAAPAAGGVSVEGELASARAEKGRNRHAEALQHYVKALTTSPNAEALAEFKAYFQQVCADGASKITSMPDQARELLRGAYMSLTLPNAQNLFPNQPGAKGFQQVAGEVSQQLAEANYQLARRMENNTSFRAQVQELLRESVTLTQNRNAGYLLAYGEASRNNGDLDSAFNALKTLVESGLATPDQLNTAYERLNRIAAASNQRLKMDFAPTPQQTPAVPVVAQGVSLTTQPVITQALVDPAPTGPKPPLWKQLWESTKSGRILDDISGLTSGLISSDNLVLIGAVLLALIVLWILPFQILKFLAKRGDTMAAERLFNAKKMGPIALLLYLFQKLKEKKVSKHRCPFCNRGIDNMEDYKDLNFVVCPHCREPITPIYEMKDYVDHLIQQLKISQRANSKGHKNDVLIEKDAMLKLVRGVLALAIRRRASDFHMETLNEGGKIRSRIDGIMYDLLTLPREIAPAFISAIKVMAQLDITERRVPQDGKISLWLDQKDYDLRVNTSPASLGEKVVIRILRQDSININPDRLGLEGANLEVFERNINKPHGVIIVTGPSGSGKSTSLYVALNQLNTGDKNIVTIEDPIEYQLQGLSQMQVNPGANFTFANGLRSILRQDPDVIMVGEIRDKETAEAALDAAMTGHLVLTTLHTIDAPSAFSRMHDLGIQQVRVANAVNLVIAQRLVRTICPDCRKTYKPKQADLDKLNVEETDEIKYVHGTGCETCMNTGYYGRLAIFEMLELNDALRALLETNVPTTALREAARKHGLRTLREEGMRMVAEGVTTIEEVIRVTT